MIPFVFGGGSPFNKLYLVCCPHFSLFIFFHFVMFTKNGIATGLILFYWSKHICCDFKYVVIVSNYVCHCLQFTPQLCHHETFKQL
jgi:hypothetical protein